MKNSNLHLTLEMKVGLFALAMIALITFATLRVGDRSILGKGAYTVQVTIDSAEGLTTKTPVEVAGIQVGYIDNLSLEEGNRARAILKINRIVRLGVDAIAQVRTKGFLGETYVDLIPGSIEGGQIGDGGEIQATNPYVDLGQIASDVQQVTKAVKELIADQGKGPVSRILNNMEQFTAKMAQMTVQNQESINQIVASLRGFSADLSDVMSDRKESLKDTMERLNSITRKVDEGRGSLGRLLNDESTAQHIDEAAQGVSEALGGVNRFQIEVGYHLEYLGESDDFKNYVGLNLRPRPDKYFLFEFVTDPNPSPTETVTRSTVTAGGATSTVTSTKSLVTKDSFLFSAQLAKTFHDFTFRGGIIESSGGLGLDYAVGPVTLQFSAFDFRSDNNERPHLKALGRLNLTKNFFLVSGLDDFISNQQDPDWFFGAGFHIVDNDIKSLLGAASLKR